MRQDVTVIVAEGFPTFRETILRVLTDDLAAEVTHVVEDLEQALDLVIGTRPTLAVIDRDLPGYDALDFVTRARRWSPQTLIMLTATRVSDAAAVQARIGGVGACVCKSHTRNELRATVEVVLAGETIFSQGPSGHDSGNSDRQADGPRPIEQLTKRELQVLTHVARGLSTKEIAALLNLSVKTVDGHRANIMAKLDIHDRVLLAHYAIGEGLVAPLAGDDAG